MKEGIRDRRRQKTGEMAGQQEEERVMELRELEEDVALEGR